jgi:hypothetical protein
VNRGMIADSGSSPLKKSPVTNAKEVAVENRAEETYYHRTYH